MIKYFCDKCGEEIDNFETERHIVKYPRVVTNYATARNGEKLVVYNEIKQRETMFCMNCMTELASKLKNIKE